MGASQSPQGAHVYSLGASYSPTGLPEGFKSREPHLPSLSRLTFSSIDVQRACMAAEWAQSTPFGTKEGVQTRWSPPHIFIEPGRALRTPTSCIEQGRYGRAREEPRSLSFSFHSPGSLRMGPPEPAWDLKGRSPIYSSHYRGHAFAICFGQAGRPPEKLPMEALSAPSLPQPTFPIGAEARWSLRWGGGGAVPGGTGAVPSALHCHYALPLPKGFLRRGWLKNAYPVRYRNHWRHVFHLRFTRARIHSMFIWARVWQKGMGYSQPMVRESPTPLPVLEG